MATRLSLIVVLAFALSGCGGARRGPTYPPAGATPIAATTETAAARAAISTALAPTGLQVGDAIQAYQPPEGAWFAAAPRTVLELDAPAEGAIGFVVLYAFASAQDAAAAAQDQASYVSTGSGRVYFPSGTRFTVRVLGSTVIFLAWSPSSGDPRLSDVEAALGGIGTGVSVPA